MGSPTHSSNISESMDDQLTTSSTLQQETTLGLTSTSVCPCSEILTTAAETNLSIDTSSHLMDFVPRGLSSYKSDSTGSHTPPSLTCTHRLLQPDISKELTTTPKKISKRQLFRIPDSVATPTKSLHGNCSSERPSADVQFKNDSGDSNNRILSVLHEEVMYGGNVTIPELTTTTKKISKRQLLRIPDSVATPTKSPHGNSSTVRPSADVQFKNDSGDSSNRILSVLHEEVMYGGNVIIPEQHKDNFNCNYSKIEDASCSEFEHNVLRTPPKQIIRNVNNVCMGAPRKSSRRSYSKVKGFSSVCRKLEF